MVVSGHRVTPGLTAIMSTVTITVRPGMALYSLITDYRVLPSGGWLGCGPCRQYPASNDVTSFRNYLKGPDVALSRVFFPLWACPGTSGLSYHGVPSKEQINSAYLTKRDLLSVDELKDITCKAMVR